MNNGISVDSGYMEDQGKNTILSAEEFLSEINQLGSNIDSLMTIWLGAAAETFKNQSDIAINELKSFQNVIEILGEAIVQGGRRFDQTEEENATAAANLFR